MYTDVETKAVKAKTAIDLLRHKALVGIGGGHTYLLDIEDVNECLVVAGVPVIVPDELKAKEVEVIKTEEVKHDTV